MIGRDIDNMMLQIFLSVIKEEGDKRKFEHIYHSYSQHMLYLSFYLLKDRYLAEDAVQDSFMYLAQRMNKVKNKSEKEIEAYVYLIVKHKAIDIARKYKRYRNLDELSEVSFTVYHQSAEDFVLGKMKILQIEAALRKLPVGYQECLFLTLFYEYSNKEVAKLMSLKYETVKKRVIRGKEKLRGALCDVE